MGKKKKSHIYLIGFMGTGKSTVSKTLKELLRWKEIEMDDEIVRECGMEIPAIFEKYGENYFRDRETELLRKIAGEGAAIVSCGGGAVLRRENLEIMKDSGIIVLLSAKPETVYQRVKGHSSRPLLKDRMSVAGIAELMEQRREAYESACDRIVATDHKTPLQIGKEIVELIR